MISIVRCNENDKDIDSTHLKRRDLNNNYFIKEYLKLTRFSFEEISSVEIETRSGCNNNCSFCPIGTSNNQKKSEYMSEDIFNKIMHSLKKNKYSGYVSYFSNNEPLMDKRLLSFIKQGKEFLPNATHSLFTNGLLLTDELFKELTNNLDRLCIDNYSDEMTLLPHISDILLSCPNTNCDVTVFICKKTNILDNRAGFAMNRTDNNIFYSSCILPFTQLIFKPNGDITLCCQDSFGTSAYGNLFEESFENIFYGNRRHELLSTMIQHGRSYIHPCKHCDLFGTSNYHMKEWFPDRMKTACRKIFSYLIQSMKFDYFVIIDPCEDQNTLARMMKWFQMNNFPTKLGNLGNYDNKTNEFFLFTTYNDIILDQIDIDCKLLGVNYLIIDILYYLFYQ